MALTNKFPAGIYLTPAYYNEHVGIPIVDFPSDLDIEIPNTQAPNIFPGQVTFNKTNGILGTDNGIYQYKTVTPIGSGSYSDDWALIAAGGGSTTLERTDVRCEAIVAQSIPNAVETVVNFTSTKYDSANIDQINTTGQFSVFCDGLYLVTASLRLLGNAGGGQRGLCVQVGGIIAAFSQHVCQSWQSNVGSAPVTLSCSAVVRLKYTDILSITAYQNCGAAINTDVGFGGTNHVSLTWLRPLA
jgi:hypothetical protein